MNVEADSAAASLGTHEFKTETRKLLDIVVHSLYSNREIFLRELISNASDALDRLRFEALTHDGLLESSEILEIRLDVDEEARTLEISDNGIGMGRDELIENIGTIARSGTQQTVAEAEASGSKPEEIAELIGQFGVGFYSSFMVADRVVVVTRRAGNDRATRWESSGDGHFEISEEHRFLRGTTVTLHLKDVDEDNGIEDFTRFAVLERLVKRYSDFVAYPIRAKRKPLSEPPGKTGDDPSGKSAGVEEVTLNSMQPIWTKPAADVQDDEYLEFYKHIAHDWNEPLDRLLLRAEGRIEYQALLYIPSKAPFDLFYRDQTIGLQLYVRKILILDHCEDLLPPYLRFVRGVVDSADLPLNLSREMVQQDRHLVQMRKWITRKLLDHLKAMMEDDRQEKYTPFWKEFGRVLKEGVGFELDDADRLPALLLFESSHKDSELSSLAEYVERMPESQDEIYYLTGESRIVVESSPQLEGLRARGFEVLYLVDPVDEFMTQSLTEFGGKKLKSAAKGPADLDEDSDDEEKTQQRKKKAKQYSDLLEKLQHRLEESVKEVRLSRRLTTSPACLVGEEGDLSPQLERILRQTEGGFGDLPAQKRVLELNPDHEITTKLQARFEKDKDDAVIDEYAQLLFGYALLAEGSKLPDPGEFNRLLVRLMSGRL